MERRYHRSIFWKLFALWGSIGKTVSLLAEIAEDCGNFGAGGRAQRVENAAALAADQALGVGPAQSGLSPTADFSAIQYVVLFLFGNRFYPSICCQGREDR